MNKRDLVKKDVQQIVDDRSGQWLDPQNVRLGIDASNVIISDEPGKLWARQMNGKVIPVINTAHVPARFDLLVRVGRSKDAPKDWQVIGIIETYDEPAGGGEIAPHHEQHEFTDIKPGADSVWLSPKQILQLTVLVFDAESFVVIVYGSVIRTSAGIAQINTQLLDLSSYLPATGGVFVTIQSDESGTLSVVEGDGFESPLAATFENVPDADSDKYLIAFVLLHEAMTELANKDICIPRQFYQGGTTLVIWGNILGTLSDQTDLQAALDDKADADHTHETGGGLQLVMMPDVDSPPVPVETPDGKDWVYYEI